jgi:hypothetical protein
VELKFYVSIFTSNVWNQLCSFYIIFPKYGGVPLTRAARATSGTRAAGCSLRPYSVEWYDDESTEDLKGCARKLSLLPYCADNCLDGLRKTTKNVSQDNQHSGRRLNPGPPNTEATVLSLTATFRAALCTKWMADRFFCITFRVVRGKTWALADSVGGHRGSCPPPR